MNPKLISGLILLAVSGLAYFFFARPKLKRLIASFMRDQRADLPFEPARFSFSGQLRAKEPTWVLVLWVSLFLAIGGIVAWQCFPKGFSADDADDAASYFAWGAVGLFVSIAAIGFGFWWFRRGQAILLPGVKEICFDSDKITKEMASGELRQYAFGPSLRIDLGVVVVAAGPFDVPEEITPFLLVTTSSEEFMTPVEFPGLGEFLARARHAGAKVGFVEGSPGWLAEQMQALPSWQPGYFDQPVFVAPAKVELSCQACGGAARYELGLKEYSCHYCGSAKLTPTATFKG
jgi:hypothetical protein